MERLSIGGRKPIDGLTPALARAPTAAQCEAPFPLAWLQKRTRRFFRPASSIQMSCQTSLSEHLGLHFACGSCRKLDTASDRLRSLFIAATFRTSADEYAKGKYNGRRRSEYTAPFLEARDSLPASSPTLTEALNAAALLADEIWPQRRKRNELIHELATAIARRKRILLEQRPVSAKPRDFDFASFQKAIKESEARHMRELSETIKQLADWYELLVRGSNEVFIVEHYRRKVA
jgi:hypothetical protein